MAEQTGVENQGSLLTEEGVIKVERKQIDCRRRARARMRGVSVTAKLLKDADAESRPHLATIIAMSGQTVSQEIKRLIADLGEGEDDVMSVGEPDSSVEEKDAAEDELPIDDIRSTPTLEDLTLNDEGTDGLIGFAGSGGGIRAASFNLGVIQVLHRFQIFQHLDYLSTVSGSGYIAASFTAAQAYAPDIPKASAGEKGDAKTRDYNSFFQHHAGEEESAFFRYLRNHANYLVGEGWKDYFTAAALAIKGAVINLSLIGSLMIIVGVVLASIFFSLDKASYEIFNIDRNAISPYLSLLPLVVATFWLLRSSIFRKPKLAPVTVVEGFSEDDSVSTEATRFLGRANLTNLLLSTLASLSLGLFAYGAYELAESIKDEGLRIATITGVLSTGLLASSPLNKILSRLVMGKPGRLASVALYLVPVAIALGLIVISLVAAAMSLNWLDQTESRDIRWLIVVIVSVLIFGSGLLWLNINRTSLHNYYRDKLSKAFVFFPIWHDKKADEIDKSDETKNRAHHVARLPLSKLVWLEDDGHRNTGPYHLINVALNADHAREYYQRGRKAEFFLFSPLHVGSEMTGYVPTGDMEKADEHLDLATAIAISGAAVAPNAGNRVSSLLGFVLALFNARLNYWLPNPERLGKGELKARPNVRYLIRELLGISRTRKPNVLYLIRELLGISRTRGPLINVSDGGHIENLGLYQLLRRKCRFIIVGDAGLDKGLTFNDLSEALRIARIDMGVNIDIDGLDEIRSGEQSHAIGTIEYGNGEIGKLLYLKATLTGDRALRGSLASEDAFMSSPRRDDNQLFDAYTYVGSYAAANPDFPHQSTADQFFDELQFEAYRALGYHVAMSALSRDML